MIKCIVKPASSKKNRKRESGGSHHLFIYTKGAF